MENMPYRTTTLTCTDSADDIPLNPDGSLPTPAQKALDILTNTTTRAVINWETHTWELLTTRHAPFGMPLSQQQNGEDWWMVDGSSAVEEALKESARQARESNEVDLQIAEIITEAEAVIERSRRDFERMQLDVQIEESMAEAEATIESLRHNVGMEVQLHALEIEQARVSEQIERGERRIRRRQARDSGVDWCEL